MARGLLRFPILKDEFEIERKVKKIENFPYPGHTYIPYVTRLSDGRIIQNFHAIYNCSPILITIDNTGYFIEIPNEDEYITYYDPDYFKLIKRYVFLNDFCEEGIVAIIYDYVFNEYKTMHLVFY